MMSEKTSRNSTVSKSKSSVQLTKTNVNNKKVAIGSDDKSNSRVPSRVIVSAGKKDIIGTKPVKATTTTTSKVTVGNKTSSSITKPAINSRPTIKTQTSSKVVSNAKSTTTVSATVPTVTGRLMERRLSRVETKTATKSRPTLSKSLIVSNSSVKSNPNDNLIEDTKTVKSSEAHRSHIEPVSKDEPEKPLTRPKTVKRTVNPDNNLTTSIKSSAQSNQQEIKVSESKKNTSLAAESETYLSLISNENTEDYEETTGADYSDDFEDYESDFEEYESEDETAIEIDKEPKLSESTNQIEDPPIVQLTRLVTPTLMENNVKPSHKSAESEDSPIIRWEITLPPPTMRIENNKEHEVEDNDKESFETELREPIISNLDDRSSEAINILQQLLGPKNVNQVAIQTVERLECSSQSDEIKTTQQGIQCPARSDPTRDQHKSTLCDNIDILRLSHFLEIGEKITKNLISSKTFSSLNTNSQPIKDDKSSIYPPKIPSYGNNSIISYHLPNGYKNFHINSVLTDGRYVYVVTNYGFVDGNLFSGNNGSIILIWNLLEPRICEYLLISKFICTKVITDNEFLIIAGTIDGSLVAWDLREPSYQHNQMKQSMRINSQINSEQTLRQPSFTTAVGKHTDHHQSPILQFFYRHEVNDDTEAKRIISLDELGKIIVWLIVESYDFSAQQVTDGLRPGSCIRLQISMVLNLYNSYIDNPESSITCIDCSPFNSWSYLIGTNFGSILRYSKYLENSSDPMEVVKYTYLSDEIYHPVTCVTHHPNTESELFLVGYMDGSVCLFSTKYQFPSRIWSPEDTGYSTILNTLWLSMETELFLILDQTKGISVRDVKGRGESLFEHQNGNERILFVSISSINLDEYFLVYGLEDSSIMGFNLSNHMSSY